MATPAHRKPAVNATGKMVALETRRLVLRKFRLSDLEDVFEHASNPEVTRFVLFDTHRSPADTRRFLLSAMREAARSGLGPWAIELKSTGRVIGACGFKFWIPEHARAEVGYWIGQPYWGQGYTLEALRAILGHGFSRFGLNRVEAFCMLENVASERVQIKAGFKLEGVVRRREFVKGRFVDLKMYAILRSDYLQFHPEKPKRRRSIPGGNRLYVLGSSILGSGLQ